MTKSEYLTELASRSEWVGTPQEDPNVATNSGGELKLYNVPIIAALPNGTYQGQKQGFYVRDEGGAGEQVFPVNQERKSDPPSQFEADLDALIASYISEDRPKIVKDHVDRQNDFALVTAYEATVDTPPKINTKRYFVAKKDDGTTYIREFTGSV